MTDQIKEREEKISIAIEIVIKVTMIALVVYISYLIRKAFMAIVVWGIIITVAISPLVNMLENVLEIVKRSSSELTALKG